MKICHITIAKQSNIPRLLRESTSAVQSGLEVCIVYVGENAERDGMRFRGVLAPANRLERLYKTDREIFRLACEMDADLYHIHDPELLRYARALKKRGKKVIFDSHENYTLQVSIKAYLPKFLRKIAGCIYHAYETIMLKYVDAALVPCTFEGRNIFAGRAVRHVLLANYPMLRSAGIYRAESRNICYAGWLSQDRGISCLIQAASRAGVTLMLSGSFSSPGYEQELRQAAEWASVQYLGILDWDEVYRMYGACMAGISTMLPTGEYRVMDTLNTKVYEYMMHGMPVIVSNFAYAASVVERHRCGICVDATDPQAIASAVQYLIDHPDEAKQMGKNGRRAVEQMFNWGVEEKKLLKLYRDLEVEV